MSHFCVLVLTKDHANYEEDVGELLAPYDENTEVPEHDEKCCFGEVARRDAEREATAKLGTWEERRNKFQEKYGPSSFEDMENSVRQEAWLKEVVNPFEELVASLVDKHPMKEKPDPNCGFYTESYCPSETNPEEKDLSLIGKRFEDGSGCGGTGYYKSIRNPKSKWDWYQIGGRWNGSLGDYDPHTDPENQEKCHLCQGTGQRNDKLGNETREKDPNYTCNGCDGKGTAIKWPTQWKDKGGNVSLVKEVLKKEFIPFAVVTPDGEWHERGRMGWFACVSDEQPKDEWKEQVINLYKKYYDCTAVLVDCHI